MKKIIAICLIGLFFASTLASAQTINNFDKDDKFANLTISNGNIEIKNNDDFKKYASNPDAIGNEFNPFIIENYEVEDIKIKYTTAYFSIRNCKVEDETYLFEVINGEFKECTSENIKFLESNHNIVKKCIINSELIIDRSKYNIVENCEITDLEIVSRIGYSQSSYNIIRNCPKIQHIYIFGDYYPITGEKAITEYNEIINCNIKHHWGSGILLRYADNNKIYDCTIHGHKIGINLEGSKINKIYRNNIFQNKENARVFYFFDTFFYEVNDWDKDGVGNFWDDWCGVDGYTIRVGLPENRDHYPQCEPFGNLLPSVPVKESGSTTFLRAIEQTYIFRSCDCNDDNIKYFVDWGDGNTEETNFIKSGEIVVFKHSWEKTGEYTVKVSSYDYEGTDIPLEFEVEVLKNYIRTKNSLLSGFLKHFLSCFI
jgi:parallel beta-helix repeat protein